MARRRTFLIKMGNRKENDKAILVRIFDSHSMAFASRKVNKLSHQKGVRERERRNARNDSEYRNRI